MKIARLELRAFGPFTDLSLDLDAGREGLHLIYGPNEAGKSSTLRALKQLLYGIPNRTTDNFLHANADLRIAAALRNGEGEALECVRRKAAKNDLRLKDDATAIEPGRLARLLGGLDRDAFETMFGIDHPTLVKGGSDIVQGGGDLGRILFAAGSGIAALRDVQQGLDAAAAALFVPRGSNPKINKNLSEFDKARKAVKEAQLPSSEWEKHDKQWRQARDRLAELEAQLQITRHEHERLKRLRDALPLAAQRAALTAELAGLGAVQILPDDFADKRRDAVGKLTAAESQVRESEEAIRDFDAQLAGLQIPEALLAQGETIERLQTESGGHRKAQRDLPGLQASQKQREADARAILAELRPDLTLEQVAALRLTKRQQVELQNLGNRHEAVAARREQSRANLDDRSRRLHAARQNLEKLAAPRDAAALAGVLRRVRGLAHLDDDRRQAAAELAGLKEQAAAALARLGLWQGELEELNSLAAPTTETIDRFETELTTAAGRLATIEQHFAKAVAGRAAVDERIEQLRLAGAVPSEAELSEARQRRDQGWRLVRQRWLAGKPDEAAEAEFIASTAGGGELAAAYERSVQHADELADRLRREADRVAERAALASNQAALAAELEKLSTDRQRAVAEQAQRQAAWAELWRPFTPAPLSPREMRAWDARRQWLVQQSEAIRKQHGAIAALGERIETCRRELGHALEALGEKDAGENESLAALVERGQTVADGVAAAAAARQKLQDEIAALEGDLKRERQDASEAEKALEGWQEQWRATVEPLGLPPDATPAQVNEVLAQLNQLFSRLQDAAGYSERIEAIGRESAAFLEQVKALVAALAPEWRDLPPETAADKLFARRQQAVADQGRLETLQKQRERQAAQLDRARQTAAEARGTLAALCQEARCLAPEELPELEQASAAARERQRDLKQLDERLLSLAGGAALDEFLAAVVQLDADAVPGQLARLAEQIERYEADRQETTLVIGGERAVLDGMDSGGAAAEAADRAQSLLAELGSDVEEYARLRLASAVLNRTIERYREKNQGPVLERASRLFAKLTVGSFAGLRADYNDEGAPELVGIRASGGKPVAVGCMSDGTADQLYLALRLASLETYLDEKEPVPFIVDDILIKFDNERSAATLEALAELSRRTQVIFFTHHEHLLELASRRLAPGEFFVHRLPRAM
ncbi:MAG TPA: AAA family ATPase [Pirellulales bacterium]|nr:AAA family ATPase [Pirellulales bacterium]